MNIIDFEKHLADAGYTFEIRKDSANEDFIVIKGIVPTTGNNKGTSFDVGIKRTTETPWVPQSAVHVQPAIPGAAASQGSPLGAGWQYLSRRYERPPTPKAFLAHILTVVGQT